MIKTIVKKYIYLDAIQLNGSGHFVTDKSNTTFKPGDWLVTNPEGEQWIISEGYKELNYDEVNPEHAKHPGFEGCNNG